MDGRLAKTPVREGLEIGKAKKLQNKLKQEFTYLAFVGRLAKGWELDSK